MSEIRVGDVVRRKDGYPFFLDGEDAIEGVVSDIENGRARIKGVKGVRPLTVLTFVRRETDSENPKDIHGNAKPGLSAIPPVALFHMGQAMDTGREKYGHANWRDTKVRASVYYDAALRHLMSWWDGEERASDSGCHHLAHVMSNMAILLDAQASGSLIDDRPTAGNLPAFIQANTKETV